MKLSVLALAAAAFSVLGGVSMLDIADDVSSQSEMSRILSVLMKNVNMHSALKFVKEYKQESGLLNDMMKLSPLFKQLFDDVGKSNAAAQVVLDILRGHIPTLKDLAHLVHNTSPNVAMQTVLANNKPFQELKAIMNDQNFETSESDIEQSLFLLTGHHFDLQSLFTQDPSTGKYHVVDTPGNKYWNVMQSVLFIHDNWHLLVRVLENQNESYPVAIQHAILRWDLTHLRQIHGSALDDPKYSVSGIGTRNQDVVDIFRTLKKFRASTKSNDTYTLQDLEPLTEANAKLLHVFSTSIQEALSTSSQVVG